MKTKRTWYGVYMGDDVYAVRHDGNVYKLSNENNSIANRSIVMIKKLIDKWFPKKYVLINVRRGGYVGEMYNLVPYKRTLSKSQNKKHLSVFYPWKHFPRGYLKGFEKPVSYLDTNDHPFEKRMLANTYRSKWWATYKAKQVVKTTDIRILAIGEILKHDYLAYATLLPYYETKVVDMVRKKITYDMQTYSVCNEPCFDPTYFSRSDVFGRQCVVPPKNYWLSDEDARRYMNKLDPVNGSYYLVIDPRWID